jgi:hypothetical protein
MQINSYLSRPELGQGAALTISGNRITTSDTMAGFSADSCKKSR